MPIKEYKCLNCQDEFEKIHSTQADAQKFFESGAKSPCCDYYSARKISKTAPPKFNGQGFYSTDYKDKS